MEYPTNREGLPLHPAELGFGTGARGEYNNHHMAFYERTFGAIAITQTFRDLESMQVQMPIPEHVRLHQRYEGLKLPHFITMLDKIWDDREQGMGLNMRLDGKYRHYPYHRRTYGAT